MRNKAKNDTNWYKKRIFTLLLVSLTMIAPAFLFHGESSLVLAFGNFLLIFSFLYWGIAWAMYLKSDGLRLFNGGSLNRIFRSKAEEWKEKIPLPHEMGLRPESMERARGSGQSAEDRANASATGEPEENASDGNGARRPEAIRRTKSIIADLVIAGAVDFCFSLLFQYIVPLFLARR